MHCSRPYCGPVLPTNGKLIGGSADFDRWRERFESILNENPTYPAMKPVDMSGLLDYLHVDPATAIAQGIELTAVSLLRRAAD